MVSLGKYVWSFLKQLFSCSNTYNSRVAYLENTCQNKSQLSKYLVEIFHTSGDKLSIYVVKFTRDPTPCSHKHAPYSVLKTLARCAPCWGGKARAGAGRAASRNEYFNIGRCTYVSEFNLAASTPTRLRVRFNNRGDCCSGCELYSTVWLLHQRCQTGPVMLCF